MKRVISIVCVAFICSLTLSAQTYEVGASLGVSNFLGDLGKKAPNKKTYFGDIEASLFRPAYSFFFRNHFNEWIAAKASLTFTKFEGDDKLANSKEFQDDAWYRNYRNLNFKTNVVEFSAIIEVSFMKFMPGNLKRRFAPFFYTGIGIFHFNPKALYNGEWVALQPLGTEGQGMAQYPARQPYALLQPTIPIGIGIKLNINEYLTFTFEVGHRFTFTDYIDDVSNTYVSRDEFINQYGSVVGQQAYNLSVRSGEVDPEGTYEYVTIPGEVRGNPGGNDAYIVTMIGLSYKLPNSFSNFSNSRGGSNTRSHPMRRGKVKKYRRHVKSKTW